MRKPRARRQADNELLRIYAEVPEIDCQGHCHETCALIPLAPIEAARIDEYVEAQGRPPVEAIPGQLTCPLLTADKRCGVHPVRPLICRLFGLVKDPLMYCRWGCQPKRKLTGDQGKKLLIRLERLQKRLDEDSEKH